MPLTAAPERLQPRARHFPSKRLERSEISRNSMIVEVALHHRAQPVPGLGNPFVPALAQLLPHCLQLATQPLFDRLPPDLEPATPPSLPAPMRESQKIESVRLSLPSPFPVIFREPPELDQPRFLRVQFQPELPHPLPQLLQECFRFLPRLEPQHGIIGIADNDHVPLCPFSPPLVHPKVEDVMQIDVRQ